MRASSLGEQPRTRSVSASAALHSVHASEASSVTGSCTLRRRLSKSVTFLFWILPCSCHCQPIGTIGFGTTCAAYLTVISEAQAMHVAARVRPMFTCSRGVSMGAARVWTSLVTRMSVKQTPLSCFQRRLALTTTVPECLPSHCTERHAGHWQT